MVRLPHRRGESRAGVVAKVIRPKWWKQLWMVLDFFLGNDFKSENGLNMVLIFSVLWVRVKMSFSVIVTWHFFQWSYDSQCSKAMTATNLDNVGFCTSFKVRNQSTKFVAPCMSKSMRLKIEFYFHFQSNQLTSRSLPIAIFY